MNIIIALPADIYVLRTAANQDIVRDPEEYNITLKI